MSPSSIPRLSGVPLRAGSIGSPSNRKRSGRPPTASHCCRAIGVLLITCAQTHHGAPSPSAAGDAKVAGVGAAGRGAGGLAP